MSLSDSPTRSTVRQVWRVYLIPLAVLLVAGYLTIQFYRNFEAAVALLAPVFLCGCVVVVAAGLAYWLAQVRRTERRTMTEAETAALVNELRAGIVPQDAAAIGLSWQSMATARALVANAGADEQERVREGLHVAGAAEIVAARARASRKKWERVRAIYDLGWLGDRDTLPLLYRAVADPDDDVAWAAVVALGGMNDSVADEVLLELLEDGRFAPSRIAEVLDNSRVFRPVSVLRERARASSPRSLFWIAYLLGRSRQPAALAPLLELSDHASADVRAAVAEALGRLGDRSAVHTLLKMLNDDAWFVRLHASRSLADLAAIDTIPVIQAATQDASWWVRLNAFESLRRLQSASLP